MEIIDRIFNKKNNGIVAKGKYMVSSDKELPERCRTEALFWKAKYYELKHSHLATNKGLKRLAKFKATHKYVARACREAYRHGVQNERNKANEEKEEEKRLC